MKGEHDPLGLVWELIDFSGTLQQVRAELAHFRLHVVSAADKAVLDAMSAIPDDDIEPAFEIGSDVVTSAALDLTAAMSRALDAELARRRSKP